MSYQSYQVPDTSTASADSNGSLISPDFISTAGFIIVEFTASPGGKVAGALLVNLLDRSQILINVGDPNLRHFPIPNGTYHHSVRGSVTPNPANPAYAETIGSIIDYRAPA